MVVLSYGLTSMPLKNRSEMFQYISQMKTCGFSKALGLYYIQGGPAKV